jgi:multidrug transporter EmrE-like cation transporter
VHSSQMTAISREQRHEHQPLKCAFPDLCAQSECSQIRGTDALLLYGGSTILWVWILSRLPLRQAYPWVALGSIFVPLGVRLWFGEIVKPVFWLGAVSAATSVAHRECSAVTA